MNETRTYYATAHARRSFAFCLVALLTLTACAGEESVAPRIAANLTVPGAHAQTARVGDEVLLWSSSGFPEGSAIDVIVTGQSEVQAPNGCAPAWYNYDATIQQKFSTGNTQFPGAEKLKSAEVFQPGTRLRFLRWVYVCEGAYNLYAFEVISVPGSR